MKFRPSVLAIAVTTIGIIPFTYANSTPVTEDEGYRQANHVMWDKSGTSAYNFQTDVSIPPNKSRMVFLRAPDNQTVKTSINIGIDGRFQTSLQGGYFSTAIVCQGTHDISSNTTKSETNNLKQNSKTFNTLPQKTQYYYIELNESGQPFMRQITEESAISVMNTYDMEKQNHQISRVYSVCSNQSVDASVIEDAATQLEAEDSLTVEEERLIEQELAEAEATSPVMSDDEVENSDDAETENDASETEINQSKPKVEVNKPILLNVFFDSGSARIKSGYNSQLESLVKFMNLNPGSLTLIEGHTDNRGDSMYNLKLSQRRADAVKVELVNRYGANPLRINSIGYGETRPIKNNDTSEGKAANRRVVAVISIVE